MNLRAKALVLALTTVAMLTAGAAAYAEDDDHEGRPIPGSTEYPKPHHPHPEENELHDRYGEDIGQVNLPPLVVKQPQKTGTANTGTTEPLGSTATKQLVDAGTTDPAQNVPVDPAAINPDQGTPAAEFFNTASIGLGVMGVGAAVLGGVAIRRTIKVRKDPKADFLYQ